MACVMDGVFPVVVEALPDGIRQSQGIVVAMNNKLQAHQTSDVITHPCPNLNGRLAEVTG